MKRFLCALMCLMMVLPCAVGEVDQEQLDAEFAKIFKRYSTTGGAVVVAKGGEILYETYYGYAARGAKEPVTEDTYFRTASVTKLISAVHIMQLVEQGKLDLDKSIGDYLGYTIVNPYYPKVPITLRHLMTHTSSLNEDSGYTNSKNSLNKLFGTAAARKRNFLKVEPGTKYQYSNFGAGIMGSLMEIVTGKNVQQTVSENLFQPLNMDAAYHPKFLEVPKNIVIQYKKDGTSSVGRTWAINKEWEEGPNPEMHYRITVGSVWMKARDLCRIGMMLCQGGTLDGVTILQPLSVAAMCADQNGIGHVKTSSIYGLCVNRVDSLVEGKMIYGHQGMGNDVVCNVYFEPDSGLVFAMVTNGCNKAMDHGITILSRKTFGLAWETFGE